MSESLAFPASTAGWELTENRVEVDRWGVSRAWATYALSEDGELAHELHMALSAAHVFVISSVSVVDGDRVAPTPIATSVEYSEACDLLVDAVEGWSR